MAFLEIAPAYADLLRRHGLQAPSDFLAWAGAIVGGHAQRHVVEVVLSGASGGTRFFLKKEHRVRWRHRCASAWQGHGWVSLSVREGRILRQAHQAGIDCPEVVALGEEGPRAFLLLRAAEGLTDLRTFLAQPHVERRRLAAALGRTLADMHRAGFDHPDLFAKHVLAGTDCHGLRFCFLDWQRSRRCRYVRWRRRYRDLAALDASLAESLASDRLRLICLRAYLGTLVEAPPLARAATAIRRLSEPLQRRRKIRDLRQAALPIAQQLVWLDDGHLCIAREFHAELGEQRPAWLPQAPRPRRGDHLERTQVHLSDGRPASLRQRWQTRPARSSSSPEYTLAAMLFRLQRFGIAAPRLLALGQQQLASCQRFSFVLFQQAEAAPLIETLLLLPAGRRRRRLLREMGRVLRQVHEAGYLLPEGCSLLQALAVTATGSVVLAGVEQLQYSDAAWQHLARLELSRDTGGLLTALPRTDRLRLALGYLNRPRLDAAGRRLVETLAPRRYLSRERQVAS
jgi:tRNA A-37 threonylcarbamoyl transferase component Bud32